MNRNFTFFLKRILVLAILLICLDRLVGWTLEYFFPKMKTGEPARITYAINTSGEDLMIFGSSKANHHYVPSVFEKDLGLSAYNAGIDGQSILYHYAVLKCILARRTPRVVVLDLHLDEFDQSDKSYTVLSSLLPYYESHPELRPVVNLRGPYEKYKTFSTLYRYNSLAFTIAINNIFSKKDTTIQGYYPLHNHWGKPLQPENLSPNVKLDSLKVVYFRNFLSDAKASGTRVYVFISPVYRLRHEESQTLKLAKAICLDYQVPCTDYSQSPFFLAHQEYFQDPSHLNNEGAVLFSEMACKDILKTRQPANLALQKTN